MTDRNMDDDLFDAVLSQSVIKNHNEEMEHIPSEAELSEIYLYSERHNIRMKKLFSSQKRKKFFSDVFKIVRVAIAIICISATILFCGILISTQARAAIKEVIVKWFDTFTKFRSIENSDMDM